MIKTWMVCALCMVFAIGCKKKPSGTAPATGSGSAAMGSGSAAMGSGSAMAGSGSAMAGSGSADMGSAGSAGSAMAPGSGSAEMGSGSAEAGSAAGSGSSAEAGAPAEDPEGKRSWNCKKECKLALHCKAGDFHNAKECELDCKNLAKDKDGRYARGSIEGAAFYTCLAKAGDCAAATACGHK